MPDLWNSIVEAARAMSWVEVLATVTSLACVILAAQRKVWSYPIGIVGTIAFFFVFWNIGLYSSAMLQVFFTAVQVYGWWYWLRGDKGGKPPITRVNRKWVIGGLAAAGVGALALSFITGAVGAKMALADAVIFGLSVVAQFFLDRKKLENWFVWVGVNVLSIYVYGTQGLALTTLLYVIFLFTAAWGYLAWRKEYRGYTKAAPAPVRNEDSPTLSLVQTFIDPTPVKPTRKRASTKIVPVSDAVDLAAADKLIAAAERVPAKPKRVRKPRTTKPKPEA